MAPNPLSRLASAVTAPVRGYVNNHFEAVKDEVRMQSGRSHDQVVASITAVDQHQAERADRLDARVAELADRVAALTAEVDELRETNRRMAAVVAPLAERADGPPT